MLIFTLMSFSRIRLMVIFGGLLLLATSLYIFLIKDSQDALKERNVIVDNSTKDMIEIPFEFKQNFVFVQVTVDSHPPCIMVLETGAFPSIISDSLVKRFKLTINSEKAYSYSQLQQVDLRIAKLPKTTIGDLPPNDVEAFVSDKVDGVASRFDTRIEGFLGHDFLKNRIIQIDYPKKVLRFFTKSPINASMKFTKMEDTLVVPMIIDPTITYPKISIKVNNKPILALVDTGFQGKMLVTLKATNYLGLQSQANTGKQAEGYGDRGVYIRRIAPLPNVMIDILAAQVPDAIYDVDTNAPQVSLDDFGIKIGNDFMREFIVTLDYPNRLVGFKYIPPDKR